MGPWVGKSIVCIGGDIKVGDYQPSMLTKDEEDELHQYGDEEGRPMTLYDLLEDYTEVEARVSLLNTVLGQLLKSKQYYQMSGFDRSKFIETMWPKLSEFYPQNQSWIFRNLSMREYIRSNVIALEP
jgi:hypothetical protein